MQFPKAVYHLMARGNERKPISPERFQELRMYLWSSHQDYAGLRKKTPEWLCLDWLAYWGRSRRGARAARDKYLTKKLEQLTKLSRVND